MTTPVSGNGRSPTSEDVSCTQCALTIPRSAKLCSHCGSYQDWRGYLGISATVLALLTALVSVTATALPTIVNSLKDHRSRVVLSSPVLEGNRLRILATNQGDGIATIRGAWLSVPDSWWWKLRLTDADAALLSHGTKQIVFDLVARGPWASTRIFEGHGATIPLKVELVESDGSHEEVELRIDKSALADTYIVRHNECIALRGRPRIEIEKADCYIMLRDDERTGKE
jgi:hypothetical protein